MPELGLGLELDKHIISKATEELFIVKDGVGGYEIFTVDDTPFYVPKEG